MSIEVTEDRFLGGRVVAAQPKDGFRAGHDTVLLAAAVPAKKGDLVLELGSGAGIASLCLFARVPSINVFGIESDKDLVDIANRNAEQIARDCVAFRVGDVLTAELRGKKLCDHVFFNPPFHPEGAQASPSAARDGAMRGGDLGAWARRALAVTKDGGTVTAIVRADRVDEIAAAAEGGAVTILPLLPRACEPAKRAIMQIRKGGEGATRTLAGFVLHETDGHPTPEAERVLRHAAALPIG